MATFFTDFSTVTNGALADSADWSNGDMNANWSATVQDEGGATGNKSVLIDDNDAWGDEWTTVLCDTVPSGGTTGDIEVVARVKIGTLANLANDTAFGPAIIATGDPSDAYALIRTGANSWQVGYHQDGGIWEGVGASATITDPTNGTYFWIRLARSGTTIQANMWQGAAGDEPTGWNIAGGTYTTITTAKGGFAFKDADADLTVDVFGVSTDGDKTAPTSGGVVYPAVGTLRFVGQAPEVVMEGVRAPYAGTLRFVGQAPRISTAVPELQSVTTTGNDTASGSWAIGYPAYSTGDLVLLGLASDANVTHGTLPGGPNGESAVVLSQHEGDTGTATIRESLWYWVATANAAAGTVTVTPSGNEQWTAAVAIVDAGTFDTATPIQDGGTTQGTTDPTCPEFTATNAGGRVGYWTGKDANAISSIAAGWQLRGNVDRGATVGAFGIRDAATTASEAITGGLTAGTNDGWVAAAFVINPPLGKTVAPAVGTVRLVGQQPSVSFLDPQTASPTVGTLVFVGQTPTVGVTQAVAPQVGTLRFDGLQPTVAYTDHVTVAPSVGTVRFDGQQPSVTASQADTAQPLVGTLRFVGQTPTATFTAHVTVAPSVGTLRFVGQQLPLFDTSALVDFDTPAKNLLIGADQQKFRVLVRKNGTTAPTVDIDLYEGGAWVADLVSGTSVTSDTGQIVEATWNASLLADVSGANVQCFVYGHSSANAQVEVGAVEWVAELEAVQAPTAGTVRFVGQQPSVSSSAAQSVAPSVGTVQFSGQQPTLTQTTNAWASPSVCVVRFVGESPAVSTGDNRVAQPAVGTIRFAGQTPVIGYTSSAGPTVGTVRFVGAQPTVSTTAAQSVAPTAGVLRFVGQQPAATWGDNRSAQPSTGAYRFVGQAPTVGYTHSVTPTVGVLRIGGEYPSVTVSANQWTSPSTGTVRTVGAQPTTAVTANIWVAPSEGELRLVGQQPDPVGGIALFLPASSRRRVKVKGDRVINAQGDRVIRAKGNRVIDA